MYYGNKANSSFFLFYGFVIENNENDDVTLTVGLDPNDPLKEAKEKLLGPACNTQKIKVGRTTDDAKFPKIMSYLRFVAFTGTESSVR